jgi:hypothetical protein
VLLVLMQILVATGIRVWIGVQVHLEMTTDNHNIFFALFLFKIKIYIVSRK